MAQRGLSTELLVRAEDYKKVADAASQYYNALTSGEAHRTTTVLAPRADLAGVQATEAALAAIPNEVTTTLRVDDAKAMLDLAVWRGMIDQLPKAVDVSVDLNDAAAVAKAEAFFEWMRAHRSFGATETLVLAGAGAGGGGGGPPPVAPVPMPEEPNPNDLNAIAAAEKNAAAAAQELSGKYEKLGADWAQDVKWENAYTAGLEKQALAAEAAAAGNDSVVAAQVRAAAATQAVIIQNQADTAALKAQTIAAAAAAATQQAAAGSAKDQARAAAAVAAAQQAAAVADAKAAAAAAAYEAAQNGATVAATKAAAAAAYNATIQKTAAAAAVQSAAGTDTLTVAQKAAELAANRTAKAQQYAGYILASATVPVIGAAKGWFGLSTQLYLFGGVMPGILGHITAWHFGLDLIVEALAVLVPALIAMGAAVLASIPDWQDLFHQMSALNTVTSAFGVSIYPITGQLDKMASAVQANVYVAFGEALLTVNGRMQVVNGQLVSTGSKVGLFTSLAQQASKVLNDLGARFVYAVTSSNTFGAIMQHAAADLQGLGTVLGNFFGILGNLLKTMPGYAEIILNVWVGVTHALEAVTASPIVQWLLNLGLAAHGAVVYIGLLGTAFAYLASAGLAGLAGLLTRVAVAISGLGAAGAVAGDGMLSLAAGAETAAALPWGWISIVAAALAFMIFQLVSARDAVQQFFDSLQKQASNVSPLLLQTTLSNQLALATKDLHNAQAQFAADTSFHSSLAQNANIMGKVVPSIRDASQAVRDYTAGVQGIQQEQDTVNKHIAEAAIIFGGTANAWTALNQAGVTSAQLLDQNQQHWAEALIEAQAYDAAIRAVTQTTGRYGAAENALNFTLGDSSNILGQNQAALQKVTQAEDALLNVLVGGEQSVVAFEQSLVQLGTDAHAAGAHFGDLHAASLAVTNDFYSSTIPAMQKVIDSMQMMQATTPQLATVIATMASQTIKYTDANLTAKTVMVDLINNALGPGTVSLQSLDKWVKDNHTSLNGMNTIMAQVTASASQLAGVLQNNLNVMLAQAAADALGGKKALDQFAQGVLAGDNASQLFVNDGGQKVLNMFTTMYQNNIPAAKKAFVDWAENGLGLSQQKALDLWNQLRTLQGQIDVMHGTNLIVGVEATGTGTVTYQSTGQGTPGFPIVKGSLAFHAQGGEVSGTGGPTQDNQMIMASTGEWVINAASVGHLQRDYGPGIMRAINSYAQGGEITALGSRLQGPETWASSAVNLWAGETEAAWGKDAVTGWENALKKYTTTITTPKGGVGLGGFNPAGSGQAAFLAVAARLGWGGLGSPLFDDWVNVENAEAGFSLTATNPSSGAYGMAQFINGPSEYYTYGGNPYTYIGQAVAMANYIIQRYGNPAGAWAHEQSMHWYATGGPIIAAIKRHTADTRIREAMALGSFLESDFNVAAHHGDNYGPFLMNLGKNPSKGRIRIAEEPNYAASYAVRYYDEAFKKAGGASAFRNPLHGALKTANIAQHYPQFYPGSPALSASKAAAGWDLILTDLGIATPFNPVGTGGTSGDYAMRVANMEKDWKKVESAFSVLAREPKPKSGKGASLWQGWLYDLDVAHTAMSNMARGMGEVTSQHISDLTWGLITGAGGGGLATVFADGHIADSRFWPVTVSTPPKPPHGGKTPPPKATAHKPDPWVGSHVYNKELTAYRNQLDAFLVQARDAAKDWGILNPAPGIAPTTPAPVAVPPPTTYTPVNLSGYATLGGPAIPVYGSNPTMGFATGGQVGMADLSNMLSGFSGGGMVPLATTSRSGTPMSLDQVVGALAKSNQGSPGRVLSEGASATRAGLNVESMTINNPVPEVPSTSITKAANRLSFLAGRGV